jgi:hypothetical protein
MRPISQARQRKLDQAKRKDVLIRALKTFVQAFLAVITTGLLDITDTNAFKALVIAGVASGISAVWNGFVKPV